MTNQKKEKNITNQHKTTPLNTKPRKDQQHINNRTKKTEPSTNQTSTQNKQNNKQINNNQTQSTNDQQ